MLVDVTHSQKDSHEEVDCCLERVEAIVLYKKVRPSGNGGVTIPLSPLDRGMRDGLLILPSLGQAAGVCNENSKVRYICLPIYGNTVRKTSQPLKDKCLYST